SGMLSPKKSLIAVFGLTRHTDQIRRLTELIPCESCSYLSCEYRRMAYSRSRSRRTIEAVGGAIANSNGAAHTSPPLNLSATYSTHVRALKRWADERLKFKCHPDGSLEAFFRYDGTTCTNMGRPLAFDYRVKLGPKHERYPIVEQS